MVKVQQLLKLQANVNKPGASWEKGMELRRKIGDKELVRKEGDK